ncbi:MAG: mechanosensitive ion channel [Myxococcales bacterium]|nr:mechanosensitive ion channel [Myxococcales bacterium]
MISSQDRTQSVSLRSSRPSHLAIHLLAFGLLFLFFAIPFDAFAQNPLDRILGRSGGQDNNEVSEYQETLQLKQRLEELDKEIKQIKQNNTIQRERLEKEAQRYQALQNRYRELPKQQRWRREDKILKLRSQIAENSEKNETLLLKLQSLLLSREQSATNLKELIERYLKFREDAGKWLQERYPKGKKKQVLGRDLKRLHDLIEAEKKRLKQAQDRLTQSSQDTESSQALFEQARKTAEENARKALDYEKKQAELAAKAEKEAAAREAEDAQKKAEEENNPRRRRPSRAERLRAAREAATRARREQVEKKQQEKQRIEQERQRVLFQLQTLLNRTTLEMHRRNQRYLQLRHNELSLNQEFYQTQLRFYQFTVDQMQTLKRSLAAKAKGGLLYRLPLAFKSKLFREVSDRTFDLADFKKSPLLAQLKGLSADFEKTWNQLHLTNRILLGLYIFLFLIILFLIRRLLKRTIQKLHPTEANKAAASPTPETPVSTEKTAVSSETSTAEEQDLPPSEATQEAEENDDPLEAPLSIDAPNADVPAGSAISQPAASTPGSEIALANTASSGLRSGIGLLLRAANRILGAGLLFAGLLFAGWLFAPPQRVKLLLWTLGGMIFGLRLLWVSAELLFAKNADQRLLSTLNEDDARTFRRLFKGLALFAFLNYPLLQVAPLAHYPVTFTHILESLFVAGILLGVLYLFLKKEPILALIPTDTKLGSQVALFVRRVYPLFYVLAIGIFGIFIAGYRSLAIFLTVRSIISIVLLLSAYSIQLVIWSLALAIVSRFQKKRETKQTQNNVMRLLRLVVTVLTSLITLSLLLEAWGVAGGYKAVINILNTPFFQIEKTQISVLSIVKLLTAVFGSLWLSGWLRKKLHDMIYPIVRLSLSNRHAADTVLHYGMIILGVLAGLQWMGVGIGVLAVFAGVIGIGIGFGTQDIANNFISGLILTFGQSVKVGDVIEVNEVIGTVREISARSTTLEAPDGRIILLPNAELLTSQVINWSMGPSHIIATLAVSVAAENTPRIVKEALLRIASEHPDVLTSPKPFVQLEGFDEENLEFTLQVAVPDPLQRFLLLSDLRFTVNETFPELGIKLARKPREDEDKD